jgi:hypothetical protein
MDDDFVLAIDFGLVVFLADADVSVKFSDHIFGLSEKFLYSFLSCN